jgi:hypothetical protein
MGARGAGLRQGTPRITARFSLPGLCPDLAMPLFHRSPLMSTPPSPCTVFAVISNRCDLLAGRHISEAHILFTCRKKGNRVV